MDVKSQPLVSIVTPVYNTEKYLAECIESVLEQTYSNWEYIIVDNCSTDSSLAIAEEYAKKDNRISIHSNSTFLNQMQNWNHALKLMHPESAYCKIVHADDWIYKECVERMVELAERYPGVGIVGSYRLVENEVKLDGLPPHQNVFSGREICRLYLFGDLYVFGSPTTLLVRNEVIKNNDPYYEEANIHADTDACLRDLKEWNFGFVHQVLSYTRRHNESSTSIANRFHTRRSGRIKLFLKYGVHYLNESEFRVRYKSLFNSYHRFLARMFYEFKDREFWKYHQSELRSLGESIHFLKLIKYILIEVIYIHRTIPRLIKTLRAKSTNGTTKNVSTGLGNIYTRE